MELEKLGAVFRLHQFEFDGEDGCETSPRKTEADGFPTNVPPQSAFPLSNTNVSLRFLISCCKTLVRTNIQLLEGCGLGYAVQNDAGSGVPFEGTDLRSVERRLRLVESNVDDFQRSREELADCTRRVDLVWAALNLSTQIDSPTKNEAALDHRHVASLASLVASGSKTHVDTPATRIAIETSDRLGDVERITAAQLKYLDAHLNEVKGRLVELEHLVESSKRQDFAQLAEVGTRISNVDCCVANLESHFDISLKNLTSRLQLLEEVSRENLTKPLPSLQRAAASNSSDAEVAIPAAYGDSQLLQQDIFNLETDFDRLRVANAAYATHVDVELKTLRSEIKNFSRASVSWSGVVAANETIKSKMTQIEKRYATLEKRSFESVRGIVEEVVRHRLEEIRDAVKALYVVLDLPSVGECISISRGVQKLDSLQSQDKMLDEVTVNNFFASPIETDPLLKKLHSHAGVENGVVDFFKKKLYVTEGAIGDHMQHGDSLLVENPSKALRDQKRRVLDFIHQSAPFSVLIAAIGHLSAEVRASVRVQKDSNSQQSGRSIVSRNTRGCELVSRSGITVADQEDD